MQAKRIDRRHWLRQSFTVGLRSSLLYSGISLSALGCKRDRQRQENGPVMLDNEPVLRFPDKVPMRVVNDRPPCLETPWRYYRDDFTPNEAFYVRWHLQSIPTRIDSANWRLKIGGHVQKSLELSLADLRQFEVVQLAAVNQCSGNSRSLFGPRVTGAQWGNGAMGNAMWAGVPLKTLLDKAGIRAGAIDVSFDGLDQGPLASVPDFVKSLPLDIARRPEVLVAYEMNGAPLPILNGFPVRLVVPGYYATYWIKSLSQIIVHEQTYTGYWMTKAYLIPATNNANENPDRLSKSMIPIHQMNVRSFFTMPEELQQVRKNQLVKLAGIAFDGGSGIAKVEISADRGKSWQQTELGKNHGNYSFRRWSALWQNSEEFTKLLENNKATWLVKATNNKGEEQPMESIWNRGGYMRNGVESWSVEVVG